MLHKYFEDIDTNSDGELTQNEIILYLRRKGWSLSKVEANKMMKEADINHDGALSFREFLQIVAKAVTIGSPNTKWNAFVQEAMGSVERRVRARTNVYVSS